MSEEKELFKAGTESGFIFQLGSDKTSFNLETGKLNLEGADMKYFDEEGNEITKEQFNELRIKKLEEKVLSLEATIGELQSESSLKVNKNEVPWSHYEPGDFTRYYGKLGDK